ncbi:hypothetical protein [Rhodococcus gannanensis]|uniref:Uncharacterized protein n=1 Tax=Rhodococcus gannanensis TaxID=1960308 RepID=A0ABW4P031_9NOCA
MAVSSAVDGIVRAIFAYEFDDQDTVDTNAVDAIRMGEIDDWLRAVADSGLLSNDAVRDLESAWRIDPELLVEALLDGVDEVTARRVRANRVPAAIDANAAFVG